MDKNEASHNCDAHPFPEYRDGEVASNDKHVYITWTGVRASHHGKKALGGNTKVITHEDMG